MISKVSFFLLFFLSFSLFANPKGGEVKSGSVAISNQDQTLIINQTSDKAIINWENFSIAQTEQTQFVLPSEKASTLNRVVGEHLSEIYGSLTSNGALYLVNPSGIVIGPTGKVDTASFIASTYRLNETEYLSGKEINFTEQIIAQDILNQGTVRAIHGDIILIAKQIDNQGSLTAEKGKVFLKSGCEMYLVPTDQMNTAVRLTKEGQIKTSGLIKAIEAELKISGGNVYSLAIEAGGIIDAVGVENRNGKIILTSEGTINVTGKLSASSRLQDSTEQEKSIGGTIHLLGKAVVLKKGASVDASGANGGGEVLVGGDYQGKNLEIKNADYVYMDKDALISADAKENGNGGKVILWSEKGTDWQGFISAKGGKEQGDGGFVEVSSKGFLNPKCRLNVTAVNGASGKLLLDPSNITITDVASSPAWSNPYNPGPSEANPCNAQASDIEGALNGGAGVTISTSNGDQGSGDITISVQVTWSTAQKLTLIANRTLTVTGAGSLESTNNGGNFDAISIMAGGVAGSTYVGVYNQGMISAVDGNIDILASGGDSGASNYGVQNEGTISASATGTISIDSCGGLGTGSNHGIYNNAGAISSVSGAISVIGTGGGDGSSTNNYGVCNYNGASITSSGSTVTLKGTGGIGTTGNYGVYNNGNNNSNTKIYTGASGGALSLTGIGGVGSSTGNHGIMNDLDASIYSLSANDVTLNAMGGLGGTSCGLYNQGDTSTTDTKIYSTGNLYIVAVGGSSGGTNYGIFNEGYGQISSAALMDLIGQGGGQTSTTGSNYGIYNTDTGTAIYTSGSSTGRISGTGGTGGSSNYGIYNVAAANVKATSSGALVIAGVGGVGTDTNCGLYNTGSGSAIFSDTGNLYIDAVGNGTGTDNHGIYNASAGKIYSTDAAGASIFIRGTGSPSGTTSNYGVCNTGAGTAITGTTVSKHVLVTGFGGGGGAGNYGVYNYDQANISATKASSFVSVDGCGSLDGTNNCYGVYNAGNDSANTSLFSTLGTLTIQGTGGGLGTGNIGIVNDNSGVLVGCYAWLSGVGGVNGTSGNYGIYNNGNGTTASYIKTDDSVTAGALIIKGVGGGNGTTTGNYGVYNYEDKAEITSTRGIIIVQGSGGFGTDTNYGVCNKDAAKIYTPVTTGNNIFIKGYGGGTGTNNIGVYNLYTAKAPQIYALTGTLEIEGKGSFYGTSSCYGIENNGGSNTDTKIYAAGALTLVGFGGGTTIDNIGVFNHAQGSFYSTASTLAMTGFGGLGTNENLGVYQSDSNSNIYTDSTGGALIITGYSGGTGTDTHGIDSRTLGKIFSSGTDATDNVTLIGFCSPNSTGSSKGVILYNSSEAYSTNGTLDITGISGGSGINNYGVYNFTSAKMYSASNVIVSGYGSGTGSGDTFNHGIYNQTQASIYSSGAGTVELIGVASPEGDDKNYGVYNLYATGATEIKSATGPLYITGTSSGSGDDNYGIYNTTGAKMYSTGAAVRFMATSGALGVNRNYAVYNTGAGSDITTASGSLIIKAIGGGIGTGTANYGIYNTTSSKIYATSTATLTLVGYGGNGTDDNNGIYNQSAGEISTVDGAMVLSGYGGGNGDDNCGVINKYVATGAPVIKSTGAAITITGSGGGGVGKDRNYGVYNLGGVSTAQIYSTGGALSITGFGGGSATGTNYGIVTDATSVIGNAAAKNITLTADLVSYDAASTITGNSSDTTLTLQPYTPSAAINIGTAASPYLTVANVLADTTGMFHTYIGRADGVHAITIGGVGADTVVNNNNTTFRGQTIAVATDALTSASAIAMNLSASQLITVSSAISNTDAVGANFDAINLTAAGAIAGNYIGLNNSGTITSVWGNINITSTGGTTGNNNYGVENTGEISTTGNTAEAGDIAIIGRGGFGDTLNYGIYNHGVAAVIKAADGGNTGAGNISITGTANGVTTDNYGIYNYDAAEIYADTGAVSLVGTGSMVGTNNNYGICNKGNSNTPKIYTKGAGKLALRGQGGGISTGTGNIGIYNQAGGLIGCAGAGNGELIGSSSAMSTGTGNDGIYNTGSNSRIYVTSGKLNIIGKVLRGGGASAGIHNDDSASIDTNSGAGNIALYGDGGGSLPGAVATYGVYNYKGGQITTIAGNLEITGLGGGTAAGGYGIYEKGFAALTTKIFSSGAGNVTLTGTGSLYGTGGSGHGIYVDGDNVSAEISATSGILTLIGTGSGSGNGNFGIYNYYKGIIGSVGGGTVTLKGYGSSSGTNNNYGIYQDGNGSAATQIYSTTATGKLFLIGIGRGSGAGNYGIYNFNQGQIIAEGDSISSLVGHGSPVGSGTSHGIYQDGQASANTKITSVNGNLNLRGVGGPGGTGILNEDSGVIETTGTGTYTGISIDGP